MAEFILMMNAFATLAMVGLIWFVQVVHYPLFAKVGNSCFADYEQSHQRRTTLVVAPFMLIEATTAIALMGFRPSGISDVSVVVGVALVGAIWLSTAFLQVPAHERLSKSFSPLAHRSLVVSNWLRTGAWSARGLLLFWMAIERSVFK
jgi:hypothetical protein